MPRKFANALLILFLLVVAVVSWQWLDDRDNDDTITEDTVAMAENETDYTLEDFVITNVDSNNGQVYKLSGKSLSHFVNGSNSAIDKPTVRMFGENGQYWSGKANAGYLSPDFVTLELLGNVELSHHGEQATPIELATQSLNIDTETRTMTSSNAVKITSNAWSFQANKMQAEFDSGMLKFQSGVEAHYAVQP